MGTSLILPNRARPRPRARSFSVAEVLFASEHEHEHEHEDDWGATDSRLNTYGGAADQRQHDHFGGVIVDFK